MDQVESSDDGLSVLEFYTYHYRRPDPEEWPRRIEAGLITRSGEVLRATDLVRAGDRLEYLRPPWNEPEVPLDAPVLYEDGDLVIFNKPAGLPVTPGAGCLEHTLLYLARAAFGPGLSPAHRLDTGTSGAVAFTRNPEIARYLHRAFLHGKIRKVYRARVLGTDLPDRFDVDLPMGRVPYPPLGTVSGVVKEGGSPASTEVEVLWRDPEAGESVVEVRPRTGRSQQIRVHLAWAGWPLVGDRLYGPGGLRWPLPPDEPPSRPGEGGFQLHAGRLELPRRGGTTTTVEAPFPPELRRPRPPSPELSADPGPDETLDRLTGSLRILQKRRGHRAATDDTLLAWVATQVRPAPRRVLDLGSGKGTVAMLLLQRIPGCQVVGVEAEEASHELALRNRLLNGLTDRWTPRLGDLRTLSILAGEAPFDLITGAPPFMAVGSGPLPQDPLRAAGRFELRGGVGDYVETAAQHLASQGAVVILMDGLGQARAEAAFEAAGLGMRRRVEVRPYPGQPPTYWIFVAARGEGELVEATLDLRPEAGAPQSPEFTAIRGELDLLVPGSASRR